MAHSSWDILYNHVPYGSLYREKQYTCNENKESCQEKDIKYKDFVH
jgi:hypothetical protein